MIGLYNQCHYFKLFSRHCEKRSNPWQGEILIIGCLVHARNAGYKVSHPFKLVPLGFIIFAWTQLWQF